MLVTLAPARSRALEVGLYRDGDNNLDAIQEESIGQARIASTRDRAIEFTVEDTSSYGGHALRTSQYTIADGCDSRHAIGAPHDMSSRKDLAAFVARTLDRAEMSGAKQTWIDLIDHGGGDGGGLEADHGAGVMRSDDIAGAIADGVALHRREHPEDGDRAIDGVIANQCLMSTLAFGSALSHAGVKYLAASPETMLAPGVPTTIARDIADHVDDPQAMARAVVDRTMQTAYGGGFDGIFQPAAAFDVLDLDPQKIAAMTAGVAALDGALARASSNRSERSAVLADAKAVPGMVRDDRTGLPWHADRPAIELYRTFASDGRLSADVRAAASKAADDVEGMVLAHGESDSFEPFAGKSYADATGPTVHFPVTARQIDPWKPQMSETDNAFYDAVGGNALTHALLG